MQTFTMADANVCDGGCKRLRERLQCFASEMGKTGTEVVCPILDKRKGKKDSLHMGHSKPHMKFLLSHYYGVATQTYNNHE